MEKDDIDIRNLREWQPLDDLFHQIPASIRRGLFLQDLNVTCCDVVAEFLALGTDAGIIFWYDRLNGHTQKLRAESSWPITCIKVVSTVEYMVAVGNTHGEITIFQIQKQLPSDLLPHELAASLIASPIKPNERYTIRSPGRARITCVEWSKNGSKLFSGDASGVVVFTEFDFGQHICKSMEILNEKYGIVQMSFRMPWLLVSTLYRAIVCQRKEHTNEWRISQIGRSDRKILNEFGAAFAPADTDDRRKTSTTPGIICSRPRYRFWMADVDGNVSHTFLLKDSVAKNSTIFEVPLLNPRQSKPVNIDDVYFGPCYPFLGKYLITYCESIVFIVNLEVLKVIATIRRLRRIQYLAVNGDEVFIVEGGRSVVRIAMKPEPAVSRNGFKYVPVNGENLLTNDANKIVVDEEIVITQGDECFELPPIEHIRLDVPLMCNIAEHNLLRGDRLLLEHSRKLEAFEKLNELDYDDSILFEASIKRKKKLSADNATIVDKFNGIVEIGQQAELFDKQQSVSRASSIADDSMVAVSDELHVERIVRPSVMEASFCTGSDMIETRTEQPMIENSPVIEAPPMYVAESTPSMDITAITFKPIEFSYPVNVNPITNATPTRCVESKTKQKQQLNASNETADIEKFPGLVNLPKLWDISIECDEQRQTNGNDNGNDTNADKENTLNDGIDSDWVFL